MLRALAADAGARRIASDRHRERVPGVGAEDARNAPVGRQNPRRSVVELRRLVARRQVEEVPAILRARAVVVVDVVRVDVPRVDVRRGAALRGVPLALRQRVIGLDADAVGRAPVHRQQQAVVLLFAERGVQIDGAQVLALVEILHRQLAPGVERSPWTCTWRRTAVRSASPACMSPGCRRPGSATVRSRAGRCSSRDSFPSRRGSRRSASARVTFHDCWRGVLMLGSMAMYGSEQSERRVLIEGHSGRCWPARCRGTDCRSALPDR